MLAAAFGISIGTLRHAVDELVAEHILARRQGRGTFVATHNADRFLFQFFHVERSDGRRDVPQVELLSFERTRLDDEAAAALGLRSGETAIQIENRLALQGRPVVHDRLTLPAALFKGLTEKRLRERPSTIYQLYQTEFGITVVRAARARARGGRRPHHGPRARHRARHAGAAGATHGTDLQRQAGRVPRLDHPQRPARVRQPGVAARLSGRAALSCAP